MIQQLSSPFSREEHSPTGTLMIVLSHLGQVQTDLTEVILFIQKLVAPAPTTEAQKTQIQQVVEQDGDFIHKQLDQIKVTMSLVYNSHDASDIAHYRGQLTCIENRWERLADFGDLYAMLRALNEPLDLSRLKTQLERCKALKREIGFFTIPKRLVSFMQEEFGVGAPFDFHEKFKDELEDAADRKQVLYQLAELEPDRIGGIVDMGNGMIYRIGDRNRRLWSYGMIVGMALLGLIAICILSILGPSKILQLPGFTAQDGHTLGQLAWAYLLTAVGVIAHIIKKAAELSTVQLKETETSPQVILDRLLFWIHVREYRFLVSVLTAIGIFILLAISGQLDGMKALLAGYTVDSLSDLFLQRFNTATSIYAEDVKKVLSVRSSI